MVLFTTQKTVPIWLDSHAEVPEAERPTLYVHALTRNDSFAENDDFDAMVDGLPDRERAALYDKILARRVTRVSGFGRDDLAGIVSELLTVPEVNEILKKAIEATRITPAEKKVLPSTPASAPASSATTAESQASA